MRKIVHALLLALMASLPVSAQGVGTPNRSAGIATQCDEFEGTFELTGGGPSNSVVPIMGMTWSQTPSGGNSDGLPGPLAVHTIDVDVELTVGEQLIVMRGPFLKDQDDDFPGGPGGIGGLTPGELCYVIEVYTLLLPAIHPPPPPVLLFVKEASFSDGELCLLESDYEEAGVSLPEMVTGERFSYEGFARSTALAETTASDGVGVVADFQLKVGGAPKFLGNSFRRVETHFESLILATAILRNEGLDISKGDVTEFVATTEDDLQPLVAHKSCDYGFFDPLGSGSCYGGWAVGAGAAVPGVGAAGADFEGPNGNDAPMIEVIDHTDLQIGFAGKGFITLEHVTKSAYAVLP